MSFTATGTDALDALARNTTRAGAALADLEAVNAEAGRIVLARANPPRKSGATAAGMFARVTEASTVMASTTPYWTFVHWGAPRAHVKAQPFILSAVRATTSEVATLYTEHARRSLALVKD